MKDQEGEIIYIGKAKDLKNRVSSYFLRNKDQNTKTIKMVEQIADLEYILTNTELEAYILETNLIKEYRPKYNILMKDDKNFAYIKITVQEDYPRLLVVRKMQKDQAKYFGPKTNASRIYTLLNLLRKIFPFRNCQLDIQDLGTNPQNDPQQKQLVKVTKASIKFPCLDLQIKRCLGPCIGRPQQADYDLVIDSVIKILEGKYQFVVEQLKNKMLQLAQAKKFEQAAKIRDQITEIEHLFEKQIISDASYFNCDVINFFSEGSKTFFCVFQIRNGKIIDQQNLTFSSENTSDSEELLANFITQFYSLSSDLPEQIIIPETLEKNELLSTWLQELAGRKIKITIPHLGKKDQLIDLALKNAINFAKLSKTRWEGNLSESRQLALDQLAQIVGLPKIPKRIECYDISHLSGTHTVASMVVFENGFPKKEHYRHFKLAQNTIGEPNDFASMQEVILRRLKYLKTAKSDYQVIHQKKAKNIIVKLAQKKEQIYRVIANTESKSILINENLDTTILEQIYQQLLAKLAGQRIYLICPQHCQETLLKKGFQSINDFQSPISYDSQLQVFLLDRKKYREDPSFSSEPDLIIIDGGKGQLGSAIKASGEIAVNIPLISLAKKEEEIFMPGRSESIKLAANNPSRLLIQHLRDEAHRFAVDFNRQIRGKDLLQSELATIPGVGKIKERKLLQKFGSLQGIKNASLDEIATITGLKTALNIQKQLK